MNHAIKDNTGVQYIFAYFIKNTGWKTLVNINEGLYRTIDYYLKIKITNKINNFINRRGNVE